jgi:hypothetical protein
LEKDAGCECLSLKLDEIDPAFIPSDIRVHALIGNNSAYYFVKGSWANWNRPVMQLGGIHSGVGSSWAFAKAARCLKQL